jgi:hypothetical protein
MAILGVASRPTDMAARRFPQLPLFCGLGIPGWID